MELKENQLNVLDRMDNGKILYGGVGSGKSPTILEYYMRREAPRHIYIITTAKKRDSLGWEGEAARFGISTDPMLSRVGTLHVDSWNNIGNYVDVEEAFFIFDEQRVVGKGAWVKAFLKIAPKNRWVILSATPGDNWMDYAPVFIANGYYRNMTDFKRQHVLYRPFVKFPIVEGYISEQKLDRLRNEVLVEMSTNHKSKRAINWIDVGHDEALFKRVDKDRWNVFEDRPIVDAAERARLCRRIVNSSPDRLNFIWELLKKGVHDKIIVFYNFDYELEILRTLGDDVVVAEWNGHKKDPIPLEGPWVYLVQYISGAEAWNCTKTNCTVFYSMTYSYKNHEQAQGRTDRMDTPFERLYYYIFVSNSWVDRGIREALGNKRDFNERRYMEEMEQIGLEEDTPCLGDSENLSNMAQK